MEKTYKIPLILLAFAILGYLAKYGLNVFLARHLSHGLYGDFAIAIRVLSFIGTIMLLGSNTSAKRFLVKYLNKNEHDNTLAYMRWNLKLFFVMTLITLTLTFLMIVAMSLLHHYNICLIGEYHLAVYMLLLSPLVGIGALTTSYLLCNQNYISASVFSVAGKNVLLLGFFAAIVMLIDPKLDYITLIGTVGLVAVMLVILKMAAIINNYPKQILKRLLDNIYANEEKQKAWLKCSVNLVLNTAIFTLITLTDLLIVEIVGHSEVMVDRYAAILTIANLISIIGTATMQFVMPNISKLLCLDRKQELQKLLNKFTVIQLCVVSITVIGICVFGREFLLHFGRHYTAATLPLIILVIGYGLTTMARTSSSVLAMTGNERALLHTNIIGLFLLVVFCSIATYFWGILGTAIVTVTLGAARGILLTFVVRKRVGLRTCLLF